MWLDGTGVIQYDPPRGRMRKRTSWWCVINVDKEITRYYRWWVKNRYHVELAQPSWDAHISIIRGEQPPENLKRLWKKYNGQKVDFKYQAYPEQAKKNEFWTLEVNCPLGTEIRKEFGFKHDWPFHLTFGRTW